MTGKGVNADELEGAYWVKKAADQGHVDAWYQLGVMYLEGVGVTEDEHMALEYISQAAATHHAEAEKMFEIMMTTDFTVGC